MPLPWSGDEPPFGFGAGPTWLPQPLEWKALTAEAQAANPTSMFTLYRAGLHLRRELLGDGTLTWLDAQDGVLAFRRESGLVCVVNLGQEPASLPEHESVLLASGPLEGNLLPSDTAVWLRTA